MGDSNQHSNNKLEESTAVELTGKIMVVAIIVLFVVVVFVVFLHLYSKWYWRRLQLDGANPTRRRRRFDFAGGHHELAAVTALRHGLNPSVLKSIPVIEFCAKDLKEGLECSVCLCEVCAGEKARVLPKCNHAFHVECIDMWFQSHSTCPLCRNPVSSPPPESISEEITMTRNPPATTDDDGVDRVVNFPTNVLFWGEGTRVRTLASCLDDGDLPGEVSNSSPTSSRDGTSTSSMSHMVIDIPAQINPDQEDEKSPAPTRLRSLKRLLSRDMRINPFSPATSTATADVVDQ